MIPVSPATILYSRGVDSSKGPDWLREAVATVRDEAGRFLVTALQCIRRPGQFGAAWFAGTSRAPNPIGYVSTALAVTAAASSLTGALLGADGDGGLWASIATATLPYAYYALLGVLCHVVMWLGGTTRPLRASLAIALYVGGGPGLLLTLAFDVDELLYAAAARNTQIAHNFEGAPAWVVPILFGLAVCAAVLFQVALASGLRGLHGGSPRRALAAMVFATLASGLLLTTLHDVFPFHLGVPYVAFRLDWPCCGISL
jgi:hypothetical protein